MQRLPPVDPTTATGTTKDLFDQVQRRFGRVPNAIRVLANSTPAFTAWWAFDLAISHSSLPRPVHEQIAVLVANASGCAYCLSAHSAAASAYGVSPADVDGARQATASDPLADAALAFAWEALTTQGAVTDEAVVDAKAAGLTNAQLLDILAVVAINTFNTTYNRFADTALDFPAVALTEPPGHRSASQMSGIGGTVETYG
jgi:uncharacterized peroxidase-related enzyme